MTGAPEFTLGNLQNDVVIDLARLQSLGANTWAAIADLPEKPTPPELEEIEVAIVSDEEIAAVHGQFMDDPSPTDVITFEHGEIVISATTALREAESRSWPVERELLLYLIHGLLHLHGEDDLDESARKRMHRMQNAVLETLWPSSES